MTRWVDLSAVASSYINMPAGDNGPPFRSPTLAGFTTLLALWVPSYEEYVRCIPLITPGQEVLHIMAPPFEPVTISWLLSAAVAADAAILYVHRDLVDGKVVVLEEQVWSTRALGAIATVDAPPSVESRGVFAVELITGVDTEALQEPDEGGVGGPNPYQKLYFPVRPRALPGLDCRLQVGLPDVTTPLAPGALATSGASVGTVRGNAQRIVGL